MKVLIATDGSPTTRSAIELLQRIGLPEGSEVTLLTVVEPLRGQAYSQEESVVLREIAQSVRAEAEAELAQEMDGFSGRPWPLHTAVREGNAAHEIVLAAEESGADLIVVGARGRSAVSRFLLGSVSEKVVKYAPCSVLVVRSASAEEEAAGDAEKARLRLLLAFDNSPPSLRAVDLLASLPLEVETDVTVLTVMPTSTTYCMDLQERLTASWQAEQQEVQQALQRAEQRLQPATPHVQTLLHTGGDVSEQILETAEQSKTDVIVVGNKGKNAVERFLLGSVSRRVVHHAHCAVWVVR